MLGDRDGRHGRDRGGGRGTSDMDGIWVVWRAAWLFPIYGVPKFQVKASPFQSVAFYNAVTVAALTPIVWGAFRLTGARRRGWR